MNRFEFTLNYGSFNSSCFVSHQMIVPGAKTVILPIIQQATYDPIELSFENKKFSQFGVAHSSCYATSFWGYAGPLFSGVYEDYGRFELDDTPENYKNLVYFFKELTRTALTTHLGKNEYHDIAFNIHELYDNKKNYSFNELIVIGEAMWDVAQENRLFIMEGQEPRAMSFAVMHQASADFLINIVSGMKSYKKDSYDQFEYFKNYVNEKWLLVDKALSNQENNRFSSTLSLFLFSFHSYGIGSSEGSYISNYYDSLSDDVFTLLEQFSINHPQAEILDDDTMTALFNLMKTHLDHRYIHAGLNYLNLKLSPMIYGPQDYDNDIGKNYKKLVTSVSATINREIKQK